MHIRAEIRHLVRTRLIAADIVGDRVYACRKRPTNKDVLPAILIWDPLETNEEGSDQEPALWQRKLLTVVAVSKDAGADGEETIDDELDELAAQVERVMVGDSGTNLGLKSSVESGDASQFLCDRPKYIKTEKKDNLEGARTVVTAFIYYEIPYEGQA